MMDFNLIGLVLFYIVVFCIFSVCFLVCIWIFEKLAEAIERAFKKDDKYFEQVVEVANVTGCEFKFKMPRYWYKFQVYNPRDPWSDGLGYVHLKSKKSYDFYCSRLKSIKTGIASLRRIYKKVVKLHGRTAYIDSLRYLNDKLENIPHSYGRKEYTGERKK